MRPSCLLLPWTVVEARKLRYDAFLRQRLSIAIQCENAASALGTLPHSEDLGGIFKY